jgi:hypothetical protein
MSYPEKGATYKHEPKFLERMKRAEGSETAEARYPNEVESHPDDEERCAGGRRVRGGTAC